MAGADIIRYMCKVKKVKQIELAELMGCPLQSLRNKLYRDTFPYKEVEHIADLLGFDIAAVQRQIEQGDTE